MYFVKLVIFENFLYYCAHCSHRRIQSRILIPSHAGVIETVHPQITQFYICSVLGLYTTGKTMKFTIGEFASQSVDFPYFQLEIW